MFINKSLVLKINPLSIWIKIMNNIAIQHIIAHHSCSIITKPNICCILYSRVGLALDSSKPQFMKKSPPQLKANNQQSDVKPDKGMYRIICFYQFSYYITSLYIYINVFYTMIFFMKRIKITIIV